MSPGPTEAPLRARWGRLRSESRLDRQDSPVLGRLPLAEWGPLFERHEWFPERTNTEFIEVVSPHQVRMRVWERGSGETLACGTGACAVVVAAALNGWCERSVRVHLSGGALDVEWVDAGNASGTVLMTGPAVEVFEGTCSDDGSGG